MVEKINYKDTLNLPRTDFPMKGNLPRLEPEILQKWEDLQINAELSRPKSGQRSFILHDGPPYANGDIHLGHTLNKVLKDIIIRSKTMMGFYSPYVPGWDCHGQPIEHEVEKRLGKEKSTIDTREIHRLCREYALKFVDRQREQFKRLGVAGEWDKPYLTLDSAYEATNVKVFGDLYAQGLIYRGRKPIHWCYRCQTALAEAEIEYQDEGSPSIYVKFPIAGEFKPLDSYESKHLLIWTTTPWTLPANVAVAVKPDAAYAAVRDGREVYVIAEALVDSFTEASGRKLEKLVAFRGSDLEGLNLGHPTQEGKKSVVILADFVALDQGTGCVHIAPGHGEEDYAIGLKYNLPSPMPVDNRGVFTEEAGRFKGLHVKEANDVIIQYLQDLGLLVRSETITHSYPHCWRCKKPVIFRATEQWFVSMSEGDLREKALEAIKSVSWTPDWSIKRISGMVEERPDWCISRQRAWGVPIPIFYCSGCGKPLDSQEVFVHIASVFRSSGADLWFEKEAGELLPDGAACPDCQGTDFTKENDIFDVWFESGVSHEAVLRVRDELSWPADLYVEGSDQHRGWFQSSLLTAVGSASQPPYRGVLTHGFLVDGDGRKMSKSDGNVVDPLKVIERSGADILRLWVSSADYSSDIAVSDEILQRISEGYRRIRNTLRFLLGSISDFDPELDTVPFAEMEPIDRWALTRLNALIKRVRHSYDDYKLHVIYHSIYGFCAIDMSSFYLDVLKDRLYTSAPDDKTRRSAQTALLEIAVGLIKALAPVLAFTAEEAWSHLPEKSRDAQSVHLSAMPEFLADRQDESLTQEWEQLLRLRQEVAKSLEEARADKKIGGSLEAKVRLLVPDQFRKTVDDNFDKLPSVFIVSQVEVGNDSSDFEGVWTSEALPGLYSDVSRAEGAKCGRCWNWRTEVGDHDAHADLCDRCVEVVEKIE